MEKKLKALILNSGMGTRMGQFTSNHPKCMTEISVGETIVSRQLKMLADVGIREIVMTTGPFAEALTEYCVNLDLPIDICFVNNPEYRDTNYIYSIYCARDILDDDILLMHGDIVFEYEVLDMIVANDSSCMAVSSALPLPEKDFKAVIDGNRITAVGIEYFENALAAQPLYKLRKEDWQIWLNEIVAFCESDNRKCYAEKAFNAVSEKIKLSPIDIGKLLCSEIDNPDDLKQVSKKALEVQNRTVYMCFSTDILHGGHISIINKAKRLGRLTIGVMTDEVVASYRRYPLMPYEERRTLFESLSGVRRVIPQDTLSYKNVLLEYKPDIVVHGDDWQVGFQKPIREEVIEILDSYGGRLIEYSHSDDKKYSEIEKRQKAELSLPDMRRARLKRLLEMKGLVTAMEAHSGITGLIVENTVVYEEGAARQFDAMWISSLCDSTAKGKPDIELVDMTSRFRTIDDIMEVTTKPIIFDGDTGGLTEHFVYTVRSLERMGVSMIIIEDKCGLKKNSLFGNEVEQTQESISSFSKKISAGKHAQKTKDFMICARIESLILEKGMEDALKRAYAFRDAGADAIMIHSRKKEPDEIFEFVDRFREDDEETPIVVVPTSFNSIYEDEFRNRGVNIVIYANQLTRTGFPAMQNAARTILKNHRAKECDEMCMSIKDIITLIPEE